MAARGPVVRGPAAQPGTARQPALVRGGRRARPRRRGARRGADGRSPFSSCRGKFSAEQQRQITDWEVGKRWRTMPAGTIFPASRAATRAPSALSDDPALQLTADRIGIASQASCAAATDPAAVGAVLDRDGCEAMLRATYVDGTDSYVITVGVAVHARVGPGQRPRQAGHWPTASAAATAPECGRCRCAGSLAACVHRRPPAAVRRARRGHRTSSSTRSGTPTAGRASRSPRTATRDAEMTAAGAGVAQRGRCPWLAEPCRRRTARGRRDAEPGAVPGLALASGAWRARRAARAVRSACAGRAAAAPAPTGQGQPAVGAQHAERPGRVAGNAWAQASPSRCIDSGVNPDVSPTCTGSVIPGPDLTGLSTSSSNPHWGEHGTWMASIIAGHGHDGGGERHRRESAPDGEDPVHPGDPGQGRPRLRKYDSEPEQQIQDALANGIMDGRQGRRQGDQHVDRLLGAERRGARRDAVRLRPRRRARRVVGQLGP